MASTTSKSNGSGTLVDKRGTLMPSSIVALISGEEVVLEASLSNASNVVYDFAAEYPLAADLNDKGEFAAVEKVIEKLSKVTAHFDGEALAGEVRTTKGRTNRLGEVLYGAGSPTHAFSGVVTIAGVPYLMTVNATAKVRAPKTAPESVVVYSAHCQIVAGGAGRREFKGTGQTKGNLAL